MLWREARKRGRHGNGGGTETAEARKTGQGRKMRQGEEGGCSGGRRRRRRDGGRAHGHGRLGRTDAGRGWVVCRASQRADSAVERRSLNLDTCLEKTGVLRTPCTAVHLQPSFAACTLVLRIPRTCAAEISSLACSLRQTTVGCPVHVCGSTLMPVDHTDTLQAGVHDLCKDLGPA